MLPTLIVATALSIGMLATGQFFLVLGITRHYRYLTWVSTPWCIIGIACTAFCGYAVTTVVHARASHHLFYVYFVMLCIGTVFLALTSSAQRTKKEVIYKSP